jgi:chromosome segregation ATPase
MGVERAVTRWYAKRQEIQRDIDALQARLAQPQPADQPPQDRAEVEQRLAEARARLLKLGPCPKPMMG